MATELTGKQQQVVEQMQPLMRTAPWIIRVTERKDFTGAVLEVCERIPSEKPQNEILKGQESRLKEYGRLYNGALKTCLSAILSMMSQLSDDYGRPLQAGLLLEGRITYRGWIPLDAPTGAKLALLCKLHPKVSSPERLALMAWRINRFSYEETIYWLSKVSNPVYGKRSMEWAKSGLRLMLAGQHKDTQEVQRLLEQFRK